MGCSTSGEAASPEILRTRRGYNLISLTPRQSFVRQSRVLPLKRYVTPWRYDELL
jgi:hypothetical protein